MNKYFLTVGITLILVVNLSGCELQSKAEVVDIKITNIGRLNVTVTEIILDGDELETFAVPPNSTYNITRLDPNKYPQGEPHSLNITYRVGGRTLNEEPESFEHLCYIEIRDGESTIRTV